jgi:hypothetical protein
MIHLGLNCYHRPLFYEGDLVYHDDHHLNEIGSRHYGKLLISLLKNSAY